MVRALPQFKSWVLVRKGCREPSAPRLSYYRGHVLQDALVVAQGAVQAVRERDPILFHSPIQNEGAAMYRPSQAPNPLE